MNEDGVRFDLDALAARVDDDAGAPEFPALAEALRRSGAVERACEVAEAGLESAPSRLAGRVALALARMDLGEPAIGRDELEKVLDEMLEPYRLDAEPEARLTPALEASDEPEAAPMPAFESPAAPPALEAVGEHEIDAAFEEAESRPEEMHSPNTMAESILDAEAPFEPEPQREAEAEAEGSAFDVTESGAFTTRTMAGLLEQQGDHDRARTIRSTLEEDDEAGMAADFAGPDAALAPMDAAEALDEVIEPVEAGAHDPDDARVLATLERWLHNLQRGVV